MGDEWVRIVDCSGMLVEKPSGRQVASGFATGYVVKRGYVQIPPRDHVMALLGEIWNSAKAVVIW